jgi:hypothetical protein
MRLGAPQYSLKVYAPQLDNQGNTKISKQDRFPIQKIFGKICRNEAVLSG